MVDFIHLTDSLQFFRVSNQEKQNLKICVVMPKHLKFWDLHVRLNAPQ